MKIGWSKDKPEDKHFVFRDDFETSEDGEFLTAFSYYIRHSGSTPYLWVYQEYYESPDDNEGSAYLTGSVPIGPQLSRFIESKRLDEDSKIPISLREAFESEPYWEDWERDLLDFYFCLGNGVYRAACALAGRILERFLMIQIEAAGEKPDPNATIGKLWAQLKEAQTVVSSMAKNISNLINDQRITGIHIRDATDSYPDEKQMIFTGQLIHILLDQAGKQKLAHQRPRKASSRARTQQVPINQNPKRTTTKTAPRKK